MGHMHTLFEYIYVIEMWIFQEDRKPLVLSHLSDHSLTNLLTPHAESLFCTSQTAASLWFLQYCTTAQFWAKGCYACIRLKYLLPQLLLPQKFVTQSVNESCGHLFRPSIRFSCFYFH